MTNMLGIDIAKLIDTIVPALDSVDSLLEVLNQPLSALLGSQPAEGEESIAQMLFGLLGMPLEGELTWDTLEELLASTGISVYISPSTYPIYYFLDNEEGLRDYAYAKYYATVHGAKLGSVLVDASAGEGETQYVGKITMSASGTASPYTGESLLQLFKKWDFDEEIQKDFYAFFILRSELLTMSAVIVFTLIAAYFFTAQIDKQYAKLALKAEGGHR